MTGRERIEAALSDEGTPETPAVICYERIFIRDHWRELTGREVWESYDPDIDKQIAFSREIIEKTGQDWLRVYPFYSTEDRRSLSIELRGDDAFLVDDRGEKERRLSEAGFGRWDLSCGFQQDETQGALESREDINRVVPAARGDAAAQMSASGRLELSNRLLADFGDKLFPLYHVLSPFWRCEELWGFEDLMLKTTSAPDLICHACERFLELAIEEVHKATALGAAGIWIEECYTDMIGPDAYRALSLPHLKALVEEIRGATLSSIYFYGGNPAGKWELILSAGADALALEESKKNFTIDIEDVVDRVQGRCAVLGNLDSIGVLQNGSDEALRAEIARQMAAGRRNRGRFIMSTGSPVTPSTPVARVRGTCDLVGELRG